MCGRGNIIFCVICFTDAQDALLLPLEICHLIWFTGTASSGNLSHDLVHRHARYILLLLEESISRTLMPACEDGKITSGDFVSVYIPCAFFFFFFFSHIASAHHALFHCAHIYVVDFSDKNKPIVPECPLN